MTRRSSLPMIAPDAPVGAAIPIMEFDSGALHELIIQGDEARWQLTKLIVRAQTRIPDVPANITVANQPRITSTANDQDFWYTLAFGNATFVATTAFGNVARSTDGTTWTDLGDVPTVMGVGQVSSLHFANGVFVAVGYQFGDAPMSYSTDGITWTPVDTFGAVELVVVGYNNGTWLALGENGNAYTATTPGGTWTLAGTGVNPYSPATVMPSKLISFNNLWVGVGDHTRPTSVFANFFVGGTQYVVSSADGVTWTQVTPPDASVLTDIATNGTAVVVTNSTTQDWKYISTDLVTWRKSASSTLDLPNDGTLNTANYPCSVCFLNGTWVVGYANAYIEYSNDGYQWFSDSIAFNTYVNIPQGVAVVGLGVAVVGGWWRQTVSLVDYGFMLVNRVAPTTAPGSAYLEYPQSFSSTPQVYDPVTDMLYVGYTTYKRSPILAFQKFIRARLLFAKIDPRSKTLVSQVTLNERDPADNVTSTNSPEVNEILRGNGGEILVKWQSKVEAYDPVTMTKVHEYPEDFAFSPGYYVPAGTDKYVRWQGTTVYIYQRTLLGAFVQVDTQTIGMLADAFSFASDVVNGIVWFVKGLIPEGTETLPDPLARIAARLDIATNTVTYIDKNPTLIPAIGIPGPFNNYNAGSPEVVNGRLVFRTSRQGGDQIGVTIVSTDGLTTTRYGESRDGNNGTFSDRPGSIRISYDGTKGYSTDFWMFSSLYIHDLTLPSHQKYDQCLNTANTTWYGQQEGAGNSGQGTYSNPGNGPLKWTGGYQGIVGIPTNPRIVSPPAYNRTPPIPINTFTQPPAGSGVVSSTYTFAYPGFDSPVPINWHAIQHDGVHRQVISLMESDDVPTNSFFNEPSQYLIDAALYNSAGRIVSRYLRGWSVYAQLGYNSNYNPPGSYQWQLVLHGELPAGTYYLGVLPYYNYQYDGQTVFCDYDFDGWTADQSSNPPGTDPTIKYRIRVQTRPTPT